MVNLAKIANLEQMDGKSGPSATGDFGENGKI